MNNLLANILKIVPVEFGICGKKYNFILKIGDFIYKKDLSGKKIKYKDTYFNLKNYQVSRILFYGIHNVIRAFKSTALYLYMKHICKKNDVFVDIGACLGIYSYLAKELGAKTILFEPEPRLYDFLNSNKHIFDKVYNIALSDQYGKEVFFVGDDRNLGDSSLVLGATDF